MTKADLIAEVALATGLDKRTIATVVESAMESAKRNLVNGENLYIRGFGSFITKTRKAKVARDISKNISVHVPEHRIVTFRPAKEFSTEVRK